MVTIKRNGNIECMGTLLGRWHYEDIWATQGRHDKSGNKLVKGLYHTWLADGSKLLAYTRKEIKEYTEKKVMDILHITKGMTNDERLELITNNL